jgi:hypothetical protein
MGERQRVAEQQERRHHRQQLPPALTFLLVAGLLHVTTVWVWHHRVDLASAISGRRSGRA